MTERDEYIAYAEDFCLSILTLAQIMHGMNTKPEKVVERAQAYMDWVRQNSRPAAKVEKLRTVARDE